MQIQTFCECIMHTLITTKANTHMLFIANKSASHMKTPIYANKHKGRENAPSPIQRSTGGKSRMPPKSCLLSLPVPSLGHPTARQHGRGTRTAGSAGAARPGPARPSPGPPGCPRPAAGQGLGQRLQEPLRPPAPALPAGIPAGREIFQGNIKLLCNT